MPVTAKIGFIGAGVMAEAILRSLLAAGAASAEQMAAADPSSERRQAVGQLGVQVFETNADACRDRDLIVLAVKPDRVESAAREIAPELRPGVLVISIAPGVSLRSLSRWLPPGVGLVRVMPNTPCLVGAGASAFCRGPGVDDRQAALVRALFTAGGICEEVPEKLMNAVTGLSGSGPAYLFVALDALADGGVKMGLPRAIALRLAAQTMLGAARMVLDLDEHPASLKDRVATPGGTTIAGLAALEAGGFRASLIAAVEAATRRGEELAEAASAAKDSGPEAVSIEPPPSGSASN